MDRETRARASWRRVGFGAAALLAATYPACAGAWIPAAGSGAIEPEYRYSFADRSFPANSFSTSTDASSKEIKSQIRIEGEQGLGDGLAIDYDLRYAFIHRSKMSNGQLEQSDYRGFQEQRITLSYGLTQDTDFADAIGVGIVTPGGNGSSAHLDSGRWAVEPIYRLGFKPGFWHLTGNFDVASRVFLDGDAAQFRSHLEIGAPVLDGVQLSGKLLFARTARMSGFEPIRDGGELYDLLRAGVAVRFDLTDHVAPSFVYEKDIAGMGRHASQRFSIGLKISF